MPISPSDWNTRLSNDQNAVINSLNNPGATQSQAAAVADIKQLVLENPDLLTSAGQAGYDKLMNDFTILNADMLGQKIPQSQGFNQDWQSMLQDFNAAAAGFVSGNSPGVGSTASGPTLNNAPNNNVSYSTANGYVGLSPNSDGTADVGFWNKDGSNSSKNEPHLKNGDYVIADGSSWLYKNGQLTGAEASNPPPAGSSIYTLKSDGNWYNQNGAAAGTVNLTILADPDPPAKRVYALIESKITDKTA